ncbi:hypothetical protein [Sphingopyxis sp.]|jgi:hypothetical protein|uniref:hypothetical protein n=1 Tax=Sphingopyxis sp. TaxID=1908224 RepID=UPI0035B209D9
MGVAANIIERLWRILAAGDIDLTSGDPCRKNRRFRGAHHGNIILYRLSGNILIFDDKEQMIRAVTERGDSSQMTCRTRNGVEKGRQGERNG